MTDGSITFSTELDNKKMEQQLQRARKEVEKLEETTTDQEAKKSPLVQQAQELEQRMRAARDEVRRYGDQWAAGVAGADKEQSAAIIQAQQLEAQHAKVAAQIDKIDQKLQPAYDKLDKMKASSGELEQNLARANGKSNLMGDALGRADTYMDRFARRVKGLARRVFVFTIITSAFRSIKEWMGKVVRTNDDATAAMARLKGALLTMAQPLVNVVIPAFTAFANVLADVVSVIGNVLSALFSTTAAESADAAESLYEETSALDGVGGAAKKAAKSLAGFDEINRLSGDSAANSGGGAKPVAPDFSLFDTIEYKKKIDELTVYLNGALLALGAILAFSGANIPLGIGLLAAGAIGLAATVSENWGAMVPHIRKALTTVSIIIGSFALAIGVVLALTGVNVPLGVGLMAAGASALGAAAALNWSSLDGDTQDALVGLVEIAGALLLAIGLLLALTGVNIPLGVGLIAAGAVTLAAAAAIQWKAIGKNIKDVLTEILLIVAPVLAAVGLVLIATGHIPLGIGLLVAGAAALGTAAALNWNAIVTAVQGPLGWIIIAAGTALLALGVILVASGVSLPLGIALIAAGAVGLVAVTALNWQAIVTALQGPIGDVVILAGGALLALGIMLALSGVALPLGIALIAAGAAGLVTVGALNWNAILDKLKEAWKNIKAWWNAKVAPKFTLAYWKENFGSIKEGLIYVLKSAINGAITLLNMFIDHMNDKLSFSWDKLSIAGKEVVPAGSFQLLKIAKVPYLAQGAVIPPNREFLAVLGDQRSGTNIEAPTSEIEAAVARGIRQAGSAGGGEFTITIKAMPGLARQLSYELDTVSQQRGHKLVNA